MLTKSTIKYASTIRTYSLRFCPRASSSRLGRYASYTKDLVGASGRELAGELVSLWKTWQESYWKKSLFYFYYFFNYLILYSWDLLHHEKKKKRVYILPHIQPNDPTPYFQSLIPWIFSDHYASDLYIQQSLYSNFKLSNSYNILLPLSCFTFKSYMLAST